MIYIFNSGFRGLYVQNVLNTLLLPDGCVNRYRYRSQGPRVNINPNDREKLLRAKKGTETAIVFIDRFTQPEYRYFPFRLGDLVSCKEDGDQMFFFVRLGPFVWSHVPETTSQRLRDNLGGLGIPRLTHGNAEETNDGYYAVAANSMFTDKGQYRWEEDAWEPIAKAFSEMPAFTPTAAHPEYSVFARAQLVEADGNREVKPKITGKENAHFSLARGKNYVLNLRYLYPPQHKDRTNEASLSVNTTDSIKVLPDTPVRINTFIETAPKRIAVKKFAEDSQASIDFHFNRAGPPSVLGPNAPLEVQISDAKSYWAATLFTILLFVIGSSLASMNVPPGQEPTWALFWSQLIGLKGIGSAVQAVALYVLARLIGKKVL